MTNKQSIVQQLNEYQERFPLEFERWQSIIAFLNSTEDDTLLYDRKNFNGHITASAFILNAAKDALLMIEHKALKRWLQPGGHVNLSDASIMAAAIREAEEETGIKANTLTPVVNFIFDVDSHVIPANNKKNELQHVHHDLRFLFTSVDEHSLLPDEAEVTGAAWIKLHDITTPEFILVVDKILKRTVTS